ncbi:MAG: hypothetical protein ACOY9B_04050 [Pseudomonadota bacterium]
MAAPDRWHGFELIAPGTHRICVRDPDDARYCLKFERPPHERPRGAARTAAATARAAFSALRRCDRRALRALHRAGGHAARAGAAPTVRDRC